MTESDLNHLFRHAGGHAASQALANLIKAFYDKEKEKYAIDLTQEVQEESQHEDNAS